MIFGLLFVVMAFILVFGRGCSVLLAVLDQYVIIGSPTKKHQSLLLLNCIIITSGDPIEYGNNCSTDEDLLTIYSF